MNNNPNKFLSIDKYYINFYLLLFKINCNCGFLQNIQSVKLDNILSYKNATKKYMYIPVGYILCDGFYY
jgi:hypothetical protein